jgi:hypothetical protein
MAKFNSEDFFRAHFKKPRGMGCWAFKADNSNEWIFSSFMSFSDAKKWAKEQAPDAKEFAIGS